MRLLLALAAGITLASPVRADDASAAIGAYIALCPAALLAPDTLPHELEQIDMYREVTLPLGQMRTDAYITADGNISVSVVTHSFPDAVHRYCVVAILEPLDFAALTDVRRRLEANALVGPLEGQMLPMPGGIVSGYFKKPGFDPLVLVTFTGTSGHAVLAFETWRESP